jgi:hypothetical protein
MKIKVRNVKGEKRKKSGNKQERKSITEKMFNAGMEQDRKDGERNKVKELEEVGTMEAKVELAKEGKYCWNNAESRDKRGKEKMKKEPNKIYRFVRSSQETHYVTITIVDIIHRTSSCLLFKITTFRRLESVSVFR